MMALKALNTLHTVPSGLCQKPEVLVISKGDGYHYKHSETEWLYD